MIRRYPINPARKPLLLQAPLWIVVALGGIVFTLSDEPAAYSTSGRMAIGAIGDSAPGDVVVTAGQAQGLDEADDTIEPFDPAATPAARLESWPGLPPSLTALPMPPVDARLGAGLLRESMQATRTLRMAGSAAATLALADEHRTSSGSVAPGTAAPAGVASSGRSSGPVDTEPEQPVDGAVILPPAAEDRERLMERTADFLARYYRRSRARVGVYVRHAFEAGEQIGVDPLLVSAIMSIESSLNPRAHSHKGAKGLMQVLVAVHPEKFEPFGGVENAYEPRVSVMVGTRILSDMLERTGSVEGALKHYVGAANLRSDGGYGAKVIRMRDRIWHAAMGRKVPAKIELAAATLRANLAQNLAAGGLRTASAEDPTTPQTRFD